MQQKGILTWKKCPHENETPTVANKATTGWKKTHITQYIIYIERVTRTHISLSLSLQKTYVYIYISIYIYIYWLQPPSCSSEWHDLRVERLVERRARWSSFEDFQSCQLASKTARQVSSWCSQRQRELTAGIPKKRGLVQMKQFVSGWFSASG